jgi:hypothetical protein
MLEWEDICVRWKAVDTDTRKLLTPGQHAKTMLHGLLKSTRAGWLVTEPGRISRPFNAVVHDQLTQRLHATRKQLETYCELLDERGTYNRFVDDIRSLRSKIAGTQRMLDVWFCQYKK